MKNSFAKKQIPTLLGLLVLVVALVGGIFFIGQGGGVFAPRATAQTTPKKITVSNVKEDGFTVSFFTDDLTAGFVKYGTDQNSLTQQASDDRDQFSGSVGTFNTHHITLHQLQPNTTYYYIIGTAASSRYDNNGSPYSVKTTAVPSNIAVAKTIYGTVNTAAGTPASGVMVYVTITGAYPLSILSKDSGSWAIPLANARTTNTGTPRVIDSSDLLSISVQGNDANSVADTSVSIANAQPVAPITLGQTQSTQNSTTGTTQAAVPDTTIAMASPTPVTSPVDLPASPVVSPQSLATLSNLSGDSALASPTPAASPVDRVVEVNATTTQAVETTQPVIQGTAVPNVIVSIQIHSTNPISTQAQTDSLGNYSVDLATLSKQLAPGQHTITVTYSDPSNPSQIITKTQTFTVLDQGVLAAANTNSTPYSTSNPYILVSPTPTPTLSPMISPTPTIVATTSAVVSIASSGSALPVTGSTDTTILLILGGLFFLGLGSGSFWLAARQPNLDDLG